MPSKQCLESFRPQQGINIINLEKVKYSEYTLDGFRPQQGINIINVIYND